MREPPLSDAELQIVRGMIDEYLQESAVHAWLRRWWRQVGAVIALVSSVVITIAAIEEIVRSIVGG